MPMQLTEWLDKIQKLHVTEMDLSLERVTEVANRLGVKATCSVITVGGTNGKGSCVAGLEKIYLEAGYRVGAFTSPILFKHNEYVRIQGLEVEDELFCQAFQKIELARKEISLTPFEFTALAAFLIFQQANLDVWILEVGLGGRFDAVNIIDADVAIVASIGIDHTEWLGDTREKIAIEKAGIFRPGKPAVCGDVDPPITLIRAAEKLGTPLFIQNQHFHYEKKNSNWNWLSEISHLENLPLTQLALQNMATVLKTIELMQSTLHVSREVIVSALENLTLPGRIQIIPGKVPIIFDVSHNPAAAAFLANYLKENKISGKTRAVFSMLGDKDIVGTLEVMQNVIDEWNISTLPVKRAASEKLLNAAFQKTGIKSTTFSSIPSAFETGLVNSSEGDRIVIFGSFHTVAMVMRNKSSSSSLSLSIAEGKAPAY